LRQYLHCTICGEKPPPGRRRCERCQRARRCIACGRFFLTPKCLCPDCEVLTCLGEDNGPRLVIPSPERIAQLAGRASLGLALFGGPP
jgi:hypothetical protein